MEIMRFSFSPDLCIPAKGRAEIDLNQDCATVTVKDDKYKIVGHGLYRLSPGSTVFVLESGTSWRPHPIKSKLLYFWLWLTKMRRPQPDLHIEARVRKGP